MNSRTPKKEASVPHLLLFIFTYFLLHASSMYGTLASHATPIEVKRPESPTVHKKHAQVDDLSLHWTAESSLQFGVANAETRYL